jgi:hypothetical protein
MDMSFVLAVLLNIVCILLVYFGLFGVLRLLYRKSAIGLVVALIFMSPFVYVLAHVDTLLGLMWVLLLTPFYAVFVLMLSAAEWLFLYYALAYGVLALVYVLHLRRKLARVLLLESDDSRMSREGELLKWFVARKVSKYVSLVLVFMLAAALVGIVRDDLRDPSFLEASDFIASDQTNARPYVYGSYTCGNYASDLKKSALREGLMCGYVLAYFKSKVHALNCFNTTDSGLIFVEPQTDNIIELIIGQPYWDRTIYEPPDYNDTLQGYRIFW